MKIEHRDFLLEIGTEELPPRALLTLSQALVAGTRRRPRQGAARPR